MSDTRNLTPFEEKMLFGALRRSSKVIAEIPMPETKSPAEDTETSPHKQPSAPTITIGWHTINRLRKEGMVALDCGVGLIAADDLIAINGTDAPAPIPEEIHRRAERIAAETREKFAGMIHALDARGDKLSKRAAAAIDIMSEESVALVKLRDVLEFDLVHIRKDRAALLARVEELEVAATALIEDMDERYETDDPAMKYTAPWGTAAELRKVLAKKDAE